MTAAATMRGEIMGTAAYMSPEQARGKEVDKRTDIWAFGVCFFEALTGERLFVGETAIDTLSEVIQTKVPWSSLTPEVPATIQRILRRCLVADPQLRLRDIGDARIELGLVAAGSDEASRVGEGARQQPNSSSHRSRRRLVSLGLPVLAAAVGLVAGLYLSPAEGPATDATEPGSPTVPVRTSVSLPDSAPLALGTQYPLIGFEPRALALSPDGRHLVYVGLAENGTRLYHRDLSRFDAPVEVAGSEGAQHPFFSPDSSQLGFLTEDRVKRVSLDGGEPTTVCRARTPILATWMGDTIYFSENQGRALASVPAMGGEPLKIFDISDRFAQEGRISDILPTEGAALASVLSPFTVHNDYSELWVLSFDGENDRSLSTTGFDARWLPSGQLVFARGGRLLAAPFDLDRLELRGEPVPVVDGLALESIFGNAHVAFSESGSAAYVPGGDLAPGRLAWVDRNGQGGFLDVPARVYGSFDLAPDDRRFALQVADVRDYVWIWSAASGGRALPGTGSSGWPVWSPDGQSLAYVSRQPDTREEGLFTQTLLSGAVERVLERENFGIAYSWVASGIGITRVGAGGGVGLVSADENAITWVERQDADNTLDLWGVAMPPDGAWMAYASQEGGGRFQIWLEGIGAEAVRQQVSTDGGIEPVWCRQCDELFYRQGNYVLSSRVRLEPELEIGTPEVVFEAPDFVDSIGTSYRVSSDGERLYYIRRSESPTRDRIHLVQNWSAELSRLVPVD